ncbi:hypothetical protein GLYMA_18G098550v4 [Glycine max]|nr:hypothetical protein GLYMA_18G098550v4 [Glycine max]
MLLSKLQCGTFVFPLQGVPCIICLKQGNCISITDNTILTFEGGLQKQLISAFTIGFRLDISYTVSFNSGFQICLWFQKIYYASVGAGKMHLMAGHHQRWGAINC